MNFKIINNHICLIVNDRYYIVDTGSPRSFSFEQAHQLVTEEFNVALPRDTLNVQGAAQLLGGITPSGLIGLDLFPHGLYICLDDSLESGDITFSPKNIDNGTKLQLLRKYPLIAQVNVNSNVVKSIIDTGAYIPYASHRIISGLTSTGTAKDFIGRTNTLVTVPLYDVVLEVGNIRKTLATGYHETPAGDLRICGCDYIFSPFSLDIREMNINFDNLFIQIK